jgi:hypothetical protein
MTQRQLYELAKAYADARLQEVFSENDLICIVGEQGVPYYVSIVANAFAAYRGERGLTGYLALALEDDQTPMLESMELDHAQECLLCIFTDDREELDEADRSALTASGVLFDGHYPQFRSKQQYCYPWYISEQEEQDLVMVIKGLLFAKEYLAPFGKTQRSASLQPWLDSLNLTEGDSREYLPCFTVNENSFDATARLLQDEAYGFVFPQAFFTNEERQLHFKRMKSRGGEILYYITGIIPEPTLSRQGERPIFPTFSIAYDPHGDRILTFSMVEEYESEHGRFVSELLALFDQWGKPQAIHCYGRRSLPLLEKIGPQMGVMVVQGNPNPKIEELVLSMLQELFSHKP